MKSPLHEYVHVMTSTSITQLLNQHFACPKCRAARSWTPTARAMVRETSTIQGSACGHCGEEIVVKVPRPTVGQEGVERLAHREYRALCELQRTFPQDTLFGTLEPLGYLEFGDHGILITRKFDGVDLIRYASGLAAECVPGLFRPAGSLLRKLHDSFPKGYQPRSLGVEDKVEYLIQTYGVELRGDTAIRHILDQFTAEAARIGALQLRATWGHGDFKPENVLCNGQKYLILDTQLQGHSAFVYDLASFLDHLLIAGQSIRSSNIRHQYQQAEDEFLTGYGSVSEQELDALRWAQLYFMLHYWGKHRQRGLLSRVYANVKIRPLVQKLANQV